MSSVSGGSPVAAVIAGEKQLGKLIGVNLNSVADQAVPIIGATLWVPRRVIITNVSTTLALGVTAGGIYTGAGKTGTTLVAAGQAYAALIASGDALDLTMALSAKTLTATTLYFALTVTFGSAATADLYVFGDVLV